MKRETKNKEKRKIHVIRVESLSQRGERKEDRI